MPRKKGTVPTPKSDTSNIHQSPQSQDDITSIESDTVKENIATKDKPPILKKRGRRPKGGKIISSEKNVSIPAVTMQENIILHLRCSLDDIDDSGSALVSMTNLIYNPDMESVKAYAAQNAYVSQASSLNFNEHELNSQTQLSDNECMHSSVSDQEIKDLQEKDSIMYGGVSCNNSQVFDCNKSMIDDTQAKSVSIINSKLHNLSKDLHTDDIRHKKSACFWCTYDFDTEVIHIPKFNMSGRYHVYGCFCSPQCATAHLMSEKVDSSIKFERYQLINNLYAGVYDYTSSIKPAPNPYYVLEKYYGNLTIEEYRDLMNTNRQMVVIDKPMTHVFPELYEDNDEFIVSKRTIPKNNSIYSVRKSSALKNT